MANININDLECSGSDLLISSESFLKDLDETNVGQIKGGLLHITTSIFFLPLL